MNDGMLKKLKEWVYKNYDKYATSYTPERSEGNYYDCFYDGQDSGTLWVAYKVGRILGMDLEEPEEPDDNDED